MPVSLVLCADLYGDAIADWSLSVAVQRIALYDKAKDLDGWACVMKTIKLSAPTDLAQPPVLVLTLIAAHAQRH